MFRGRIATIGLKQVENQMKPNKCDFCTLLIMLYFCTENERNLFSIENRPVGFYTECLLIVQLMVLSNGLNSCICTALKICWCVSHPTNLQRILFCFLFFLVIMISKKGSPSSFSLGRESVSHTCSIS